MSTQPVTGARRMFIRYSWGFGLAFVLLVGVLAVNRRMPAASQPVGQSIQAPADTRAAQALEQSPDQAQKSVFDYLRAHEQFEQQQRQQPVWNQATQAVLDYLRAHSGDHPVQLPKEPLDQAQKSVFDYLRAHEQFEQQQRQQPVWNQATQAVLDYLRAHSR